MYECCAFNNNFEGRVGKNHILCQGNKEIDNNS